MVQMPRGADALVGGSFAADGLPVGAERTAAAVGVRVVTVSARRGGVLLGVAPAGAEPVAGTLLAELGGGDDAMVGEPADRTLGVATVGVVAAEAAGIVGHRAPW